MKKENKMKDEKLSFEAAQEKLETIVAQLEQGNLSLDEGLTSYEEGVKLLRLCNKKLESAERKIELLCGVDAEGNPITKPFDEEDAGNLVEKSQTRSRRRSAKE